MNFLIYMKDTPIQDFLMEWMPIVCQVILAGIGIFVGFLLLVGFIGLFLSKCEDCDCEDDEEKTPVILKETEDFKLTEYEKAFFRKMRQIGKDNNG